MADEDTCTTNGARSADDVAHEWYYLVGEEHFGPVSGEEMQTAVQSGKLNRDTYVFREGLTAWIRLGDCVAINSSPVPLRAWFLWWPESVTASTLLTLVIFSVGIGICSGLGDPSREAFFTVVFYLVVMGARAGTVFLWNRVFPQKQISLRKPLIIALKQKPLLRGLALGVLLGALLLLAFSENASIKVTSVFFLFLVGVGWVLVIRSTVAPVGPQKITQRQESPSPIIRASPSLVLPFRLWPWKKIGWSVGIVSAAFCTLWLTAWIVSEVRAAQEVKQAELRRQAEDQRVGEEQRQQASDPEMRQRTQIAWKQIQTVQASCSEMYQQHASPATLFSRRAYLFTQVDLDHADPRLVQWVRDSIANANGYLAVAQTIEEERAKTKEFNQGTETFFNVLGLVAGAIANNDRSQQDNVQLGQIMGNLAGKGSTLLVDSAAESDLKKKYGGRFYALDETRKLLDKQRRDLASFLSQKYGTTLLDAN